MATCTWGLPLRCLSSNLACSNTEHRESKMRSVHPLPRWPYGETPCGACRPRQMWGHAITLENWPLIVFHWRSSTPTHTHTHSDTYTHTHTHTHTQCEGLCASLVVQHVIHNVQLLFNTTFRVSQRGGGCSWSFNSHNFSTVDPISTFLWFSKSLKRDLSNDVFKSNISLVS